jgi:CheY-like chemotaxis protein
MRVLVVDDDMDTLEIFSALLGLWDHEVRTVQDAPLALSAALEFRPDFVLLDLGMPETDGYQVARLIREQPLLKATVLAAVTGYGMEEDRARTRAAGFDLHLLKPVDPVQLKALLNSPPAPSPRKRPAKPSRLEKSVHPGRATVVGREALRTP